MISQDLILETNKAVLRPVAIDDFDSFLKLAQQDLEMWQYFSLNLADAKQLKHWMEMAFTDKAANTSRAFTIIDKNSGQIGGSSSRFW